MYAATFYFLGLAGCIVAAMACLTRGRRAGQHCELDLEDLHSASMSLVMAGTKPTWNEFRSLWMIWYAKCQQKAIVRQKAIYSWARTLSLCAVLCLIGVLLEIHFDKHLSLTEIISEFFR